MIDEAPLPHVESPASRQAKVVAWYRKNGKYPDSRIAREYHGTGDEYVIGDWSWNKRFSDYLEFVDEITARI